MAHYRRREEFRGPMRGLLEMFIDDDPDMLRYSDFLYETHSHLPVTVKCIKFEEGGAVGFVKDDDGQDWFVWPIDATDEQIIADCEALKTNALDALAKFALNVAYQYYRRN